MKLQDWRDEALGDKPIGEPVDVAIETSDEAIDILIGGADEDPTAPRACSVRVELEGDTVRVMIYDSLCDAPRIFGIESGKPMEEIPNDWHPVSTASIDL